MDKHTHCYIGRKSCGCVVAVVTDCGDKLTADAVAEFVLEGLTLERVSFDVYRSEVVSSPGFMDCPHGQMELPGLS